MANFSRGISKNKGETGSAWLLRKFQDGHALIMVIGYSSLGTNGMTESQGTGRGQIQICQIGR